MSRKERCQRKSFPGITQFPGLHRKTVRSQRGVGQSSDCFWKYGGAGVRRLIHHQLKGGGVAEAA